MIRKVGVSIVAVILITCIGATISGVYTEQARQDETLAQIERNYKSRSKLTTFEKYKLYQELENYRYNTETKLFIYGYINFQEDKLSVAKQYFASGVMKQNRSIPKFVKFYNYKFLIEILAKEQEYSKAVEYADEVFKKFNIKDYNYNYTQVWDVLWAIREVPESTRIMIKYMEAIQQESGLRSVAKSYYTGKLISLYMLEKDYLRAIEEVVEILSIKSYKDEEYYKGKALVNLAIMYNNLDANEVALEILNSIDVDIESQVKKADLEIYKLINLAQININMNQYEEALDALEKVGEHIGDLPEAKRKAVEGSRLIKKAYAYINKGESEAAKRFLAEAGMRGMWGDVYSYQTLQSEYMRVVSEVCLAEGAYLEAEEIYKAFIAGTFRGGTYCDYKNALEKLDMIYSSKGEFRKVEEIEEEIVRIDSKWRSYQGVREFEYIQKKKQIEEAKKHNKSIRIQSFIYLTVLGVASVFITKQSILPWWRINYLKKKVKKLIENQNYFLVFQPIVDPKTERIIGLETLLRLKENGKIVYPNILIAELKQAGMIDEITLWEIREIDRIYDEIKKIEGINEEVYISVNISLNEVINRAFIEEIKKQAQELLGKGAQICLEITEDVGMIDELEIKKNITELIEYGFKIAIDDFGVEYSNIAMLDHFDFQVLKLDKHFIDNLGESVVVQNLMKVINELAIELKISIVVEGVEEEWQKEKVKEYSSDTFYIQGYYYSKPLELEELKKYKVKGRRCT